MSHVGPALPTGVYGCMDHFIHPIFNVSMVQVFNGARLMNRHIIYVYKVILYNVLNAINDVI